MLAQPNIAIGADEFYLWAPGDKKLKHQIEIPYIGGILSENSYKLPTRGTKPVVKRWMSNLADEVRNLKLNGETYRVGIRGLFYDERRPDISNLFKVVSDAVQKGLGINDKYFTLIDNGYETGYLEPKLVITIEPR